MKRLITSLEALGTALGTVSGTSAAIRGGAAGARRRVAAACSSSACSGTWRILATTTALLRELAGLVDYLVRAATRRIERAALPPTRVRLDRSLRSSALPSDHFCRRVRLGSPSTAGRVSKSCTWCCSRCRPCGVRARRAGSPLKQLRAFPFRAGPGSASPPSITLRFDVDLALGPALRPAGVDEWTLALDLEGALGPSVALVLQAAGQRGARAGGEQAADSPS